MTKPSHRRLGRGAVFDIPNFGNEPIYFESPHSSEDVLYSGSEDEYYENPSIRSRRYEEQARRFLAGRQPVLLSASLQGPFGKDSGWTNPWKGKGGRVVSRPGRIRTRETALSAVDTVLSVNGKRQQERTPRSTSPSDELWNPSAKKRAGSHSQNSSWLRRRSLKRAEPNTDERAQSPTPTIHSNKYRKLASSERSFSGLVEADVQRRGEAEAEKPIEVLEEEESVSQQQAELCAAMSMPIDVPSDESNQPPESSNANQQEAEGDVVSSKDGSSFEDGTLPNSLSIAERPAAQLQDLIAVPDDTTSFAFDHGASTEGDVLIRNFYEGQNYSGEDTGPAESVESAGNEHELLRTVEGRVAVSGTSSSQGPPQSHSQPSGQQEVTVVSGLPDNTAEMDSSRLATQEQSPWAQSILLMPDTTCARSVEAGSEDISLAESDPTPEVLDRTQSPWTEESFPASKLAAPVPLAPLSTSSDKSMPASVAGDDPDLSLEPNPWVEETSRAEISQSLSFLSSPDSPNAPSFAPQLACAQQENSAPAPSDTALPSPIETTPSTPETKQSSLPTPDLTVSIKSFRRFRSPSPTPPPRWRTKQGGGLRSALLPPRSKRDAGSRNARRHVCFALPEEDKTESDFLFTYRYGFEDEEDVSLKSTERPLEKHGQRTMSPPPQESVMKGALPCEVEKFRDHFASVASRCHQQSMEHSVRGSGSHLQSTVPRKQGTMDIVGSWPPSNSESSTDHSTGGKDRGDGYGDKENADIGGASAEHVYDEPVDDVLEVLENLDSFLGVWDMDAELSKLH